MELKFEMNEREKLLFDLLQAFPDHFYVDCPIPNQRESLIDSVMTDARENGWTDEFIRICEENKGAEFKDIIKLIFSKDRYPGVMIYDEETGKILGYGRIGNFPNGMPRGYVPLEDIKNDFKG